MPIKSPPVIDDAIIGSTSTEISLLISDILKALSKSLSPLEKTYFKFLLECNVGLNYGRDDATNFHFDNDRLTALRQGYETRQLYNSIMKMLKDPNNNLFLNIAEMFNLFETMQHTLGASHSHIVINILSLNISLTLVTKYIQSNPAIYTPPVCQQRLKKILFTILTDKNFINDISRKFPGRWGGGMSSPSIYNPSFEELIVFEVFIMVFTNLSNHKLSPIEMKNLLEKFSIAEYFWSFYTPHEFFDNDMNPAGSRVSIHLARIDIINAAIGACGRHSELEFHPQSPHPSLQQQSTSTSQQQDLSSTSRP